MPQFQSPMGIPVKNSHKWCFFIIFFYWISPSEAGDSYLCIENGNYLQNSSYSTNLNSLFSSLPTNIGNSGFINASTGDATDSVSAMAICRADMQLDECRSCVRYATVAIATNCPSRKQAILWTYNCTLQYSNESILRWQGTRMIVRYTGGYRNRQMVANSSLDQFNEDLRILLDGLRQQAAAGGPMLKVAAGNQTGPDFLTIYALVQCTPDLSSDDCDSCLRGAAGRIQGLNGLLAIRILSPSCIVWYDTHSPAFYNLSRLREVEELVAPLPSPEQRGPAPPPPGTAGGRTIFIIVVSIVSCLILVAAVAIVLRRKQRKKRPQEMANDEEEIGSADSLQYVFEKIRATTNNFSENNKLGHGGFGAVYKGKLEGGEEIAVKRLSRGSAQGDLEFKNEVLLVAKLQHRNLVKLYGFAIDGLERILIYEFVQNASLDRFIFDSVKRSYLDWDRRYKIIRGIARGLLYLHEDSRFCIIHRDLKASNILLDGEMNPKIADFGMARLFVANESQDNTSRVVGTYGYMAPEYALHGQLSLKIDVFSFGVLVLEIVSGQKNNSFMVGSKMEDMLSFAWRSFQDGMIKDLIDPTLRSGSGLMRDMLRCIHIGLLCVQKEAADRPTMSSVVLMLNSSSVTMPIPYEPPFYMSRKFDSSSRDTGFSRSVEESVEVPQADTHPSINDASITELYPR